MSPATDWADLDEEELDFGGAYALRVVHTNGGRSAPFVVSMGKLDLERFARLILDDQSPEARLAGGRFWGTVHRLRHHCRNWDCQIGDVMVSTFAFGRSAPVPGDSDDRRLSDFELAILFGVDDEAGYHALGALGIKDPDKALARTVLSWLPRIEEWGVPPTT